MSNANARTGLTQRNAAPTGFPSLLPTPNSAASRALPSAGAASQAFMAAGRGNQSQFGFGPGTGLSSAGTSAFAGPAYPRVGLQAASNALPPPVPNLASNLNGPSFANPAPNLDSSEFPALGGNPGASSVPSSTPGLLSTYASQAGTNLPPSTSLISAQPPRDFSSEDFPALGPGPNDVLHNPLHSVLNGTSMRQQQAHQQEQQSAAAALAHRQGLLGSLGSGVSSVRNGTGPLAAAVDEQKRVRSSLQRQEGEPFDNIQSQQNYGLKLGGAGNASSAAGSPPGIPSAIHSQNQMANWQHGAHANGPPVLSNGISPAPGGSVMRGSSPSDESSISHQHRTEMPQTAAEQIIVSPADRFGLLGLLHLIKHATPGQSLLSLGSDLSKLGLEMGRRDPLSTDFATPWAEPDTVVEPEFSIPACYNVNPPSALNKITNFSDETLFFIFYAQPRDYMQELSAQELYKHNWRYHKELKVWLTKEAGVEPTQKTNSYERGSYIFFEPMTWEKQKRDFLLVYDQLESRPNAHMQLPANATQQPAQTAASLPLS